MNNNWISIKDSLPEEDQEVFVGRTPSVVRACAYPAMYSDGKFFCFGIGGDTIAFENPTHWMPMLFPEPPQ